MGRLIRIIVTTSNNNISQKVVYICKAVLKVKLLHNNQIAIVGGNISQKITEITITEVK